MRRHGRHRVDLRTCRTRERGTPERGRSSEPVQRCDRREHVVQPRGRGSALCRRQPDGQHASGRPQGRDAKRSRRTDRRGYASINTINAHNGSDVTIGGNASGNIELNGGTLGTRTARVGGAFTGTANQGTLLSGQQATDPNFADRFPEIDFSALEAESAFFATLTGTAFDTSDVNDKKIVGAPDATGLSVHSASLSDLGRGGYSFDLNGASTVIINVAGTTGSFGMNALGGTFALAENVIWNFYEATAITLNTAIIGSVLAPFADMSGFGGSTEGSVIAKSIALTNGELHSRTFTGTLPTAGTSLTTPIPLPAGLPLLAAGLGGLTLLRRRAA